MLTLVEFKDKKAVAVLGSCGSGMGSCGSGMGSCSVLGFLGFRRCLLAIYLTSFVKYWIGYWIYEIYVDLLIAE